MSRNRFEAATAPVRTYYHERLPDEGEGLEEQHLENLLVSDKFPCLYLRAADAAKPGALTFRAAPEEAIREIQLSIRMRRLGSRGGPVTLAVDLSEDGGATWKEREIFTEQAGHEMSHMWFNHSVREGVKDGSQTRIRLRAMNGGFEKVSANSDVRAQAAANSALPVTREWSEDGQAKPLTRTFAPDAPPRDYEIEVKAG